MKTREERFQEIENQVRKEFLLRELEVPKYHTSRPDHWEETNMEFIFDPIGRAGITIQEDESQSGWFHFEYIQPEDKLNVIEWGLMKDFDIHKFVETIHLMSENRKKFLGEHNVEEKSSRNS